MTVIYYCDASSCGKKEVGRSNENGHIPPDGWSSFAQGIETADACSQEHADAIVAANTPEEPEEEETEAEDS